MGVEPEFKERMRRWVVERLLAEHLEGLPPHYLRVGDDAVDSLLAIDIGVVLDSATEGIFDGFGDGGNGGDNWMTG